MPFIELTTIQLGPLPWIGYLPIQPFGLLVAIGIMVGTSVAVRYVNKYQGSEDALRYLGLRCVIFGFITCHLLDVFFYTPEKLKNDPWLVFRVWEGIASTGGLLGATIAFTYYAKKVHAHYLRYGDAIIFGFVVGFTFGRIGCATAHDHLGQETDFPLGVTLPALNRCKEFLENGVYNNAKASLVRGCANWRLPNGKGEVTAHDLGLYEVFICLTLILILALITKYWKTRRPGTIIAVSAFFYAPIRFFLDFLRFPDSDPLYLGITPAQHICIWTFIGGVVTVRAMGKEYNRSLYESDEERAKLKIPGLPREDKDGESAKGKASSSNDKGGKPKANAARKKPKAQVVRKKRK